MMKQFSQLLFVLCVVTLLSGCGKDTSVISLAGQWEFALDSTDVGVSEQWYEHSLEHSIQLPGTTDMAGYGVPCDLEPSISKPQILHLTRKNRYVGPAWYAREVVIPSEWNGKNIELKLERVIWQTRVWVDGKEVGEAQESLVAPHCYNLTDYLPAGKHRIVIRVDNSKRYDISTGDMAHAYTDHTQIIWNGILGEISLTAHDDVFLKDIQVYPDIENRQIRVKGRMVNTGVGMEGQLSTKVRRQGHSNCVSGQDNLLQVPSGETELDFLIPMGDDIVCWSEFTPELYELDLKLVAGDNLAKESVSFGMRRIHADRSSLLINGRSLFLRGTLECCVFPLTGCPPTTEDEWTKVFTSAREWGLNHLRFHSWCPPEAAFAVADKMGFYLQVELPLWSLTVGEDKGMNAFLYAEADRILSEYGNHPSFCFLSLGNELQPDFNFLGDLLRHVKSADSRHLYATSSFTFERGHGDWPEADDDYFITQWMRKGWVRGQGVFNSEVPAFDKDYSASVDSVPVPVVTHEIGQYAVYPDLKEIDRYTGVLEPLNFRGVKQELQKKGLLDKADDYLFASGRLAYILYKEELERAMKTPGISGIQLLGLQDFPGQGTALVGLLNAFWESKGVADAAEFTCFASPVVPLARYPKAVYRNNETFAADMEIANYGPEEIDGKNLKWTLTGRDNKVFKEGILPLKHVKIGGGNRVGQVACNLSEIKEAERLTFSVAIEGTDYKNSWHVWVYPSALNVQCGDIVVTDELEEARQALEAGRKVLFNPSYTRCAGVQGKFVPVFWSPVHFPQQAGTMGLLLDPSHKAFAHFPTEGHTDWQWWSLTTQSRALVVDGIYRSITPLVEYVDNFAHNRRLATLFEANCLNGKLLFCSMDLLEEQDSFPEKRQLLYSLLAYMQSDDFLPSSSISFADVSSLLIPQPKDKKESPESIY